MLARGGYGFFNASGVVSIRQGVIANQLDSAGAIDIATPINATTLDNVTFRDNARDVIDRRSDLPTASMLPAPTPI